MAKAMRRGRKRVNGDRTPAGHLSRCDARTKRERDMGSVVELQRAKLVGFDKARLQKAESPLGRLLLNRVIDEAAFDAGERWAKDVARVRRVYHAPKPHAGKSAPGTDSDIPDDLARRWKQNHVDAFAALHAAGHTALMAVNDICIYERDLPVFSFPSLLRGLRALVAFYERRG